MLRKAFVAALIAGTVLIAPALPANAGGHVVKATQSLTFSPHKIVIQKGDDVTWKNTASFKHTVTSTSSNWSKNTKLRPGGKTEFRFRRKGRYTYKCTIHAGMTGKVIVR